MHAYVSHSCGDDDMYVRVVAARITQAVFSRAPYAFANTSNNTNGHQLFFSKMKLTSIIQHINRNNININKLKTFNTYTSI